MKRRPTTQRTKAKALTDPRPEFVSLVSAGANKTPFRALRRAGEPGDTESRKGAFDIARIEFSAEKFKSAGEVAQWLAAGGYQDAVVGDTDGGFVVCNGDVPPDGECTMVEGDGYTMYVTEVADVTAEKSEIRKKYDVTAESLAEAWDNSKSVKEVLQNVKHAPPGLMDMTMAMYDAMRNSMRVGDVQAAKAAINEFSSLFDQLLEIFPGTELPTMKAVTDAIAPEVEMTKETIAETSAEQAVKEEDELVVEATESVEADDDASEEDAEKMSRGKKPKMPAGAASAMKEDEDDDETAEADEAVAETAEVEEESEGEAVAKSEDGGSSMVAVLAAVGELAKSVKELGDTLSAKQDELAQRVEAVEESRQTRKGADVDEATTSSKGHESVTDSMAELRKRSMLGMRG